MRVPAPPKACRDGEADRLPSYEVPVYGACCGLNGVIWLFSMNYSKMGIPVLRAQGPLLLLRLMACEAWSQSRLRTIRGIIHTYFVYAIHMPVLELSISSESFQLY